VQIHTDQIEAISRRGRKWRVVDGPEQWLGLNRLRRDRGSSPLSSSGESVSLPVPTSSHGDARIPCVRPSESSSGRETDSPLEERGLEPSVPPKAIQTEPLFRTVHDAPLAAPSADRLDLVGMDLHAEGN